MRRKVLMAAVLFITVWLLWEAEALREAAREGLAICAGSVIPALFPFLAASSLLLKLGFGEWLAGPLAPLMGLYRLPGEAAGALVLGLAGGYPVGARTAAELYLAQNGIEAPARFDVAEVYDDETPPRIEYIENAFE